jgi:sucrose-6-phosphate hydrolase SacC (GH32 family)
MPFWKLIFLALALLIQISAAQEEYRPVYHFTPPANWMNDPNGLVYFDGEYHLFYQHNPEGIRWGHMSWGHAVSSDLITWEHLPIALPELEDLMAFSGSVVVDQTNSAGFGKNTMIALYTGYRPSNGHQAQYLAYSTDRGRTWKRYGDKPVLDIQSTDFRDPKVFRYGGEWRMVIALPTERRVSFYSSADLKSWTWLSNFGPQGAVGGAWECPDLFRLPVDNWEGESRWVLQVDLDRRSRAGGSGGQYFLGTFDGIRFVVDQPSPRLLPPSGKRVASSWKVSEEVESIGSLVRSEDSGTGKAVSASFVIDRPWLNFQMKGGRHPGSLGVRLVLNDNSLRQSLSATVKETTGFNSTDFDWTSWDVSPWQGQTAQLQFFDETDKLWGRLAVRDAQLSHQKAPQSIDLARWVDYGPDFYACVSFADTTDPKLWLAWMSNWLYAQEMPTDPWRSAMTVPRRVFLKRIGDSVELCQLPVSQLNDFRTDPKSFAFESLPQDFPADSLTPSQSGELSVDFQQGQAEQLHLEILGLSYLVDFSTRTLTLTRGPGQTDFHETFPLNTTIPLRLEANRFQATFLYDQSSVELFTDQGAVTVTTRSFPVGRPETKLSTTGGRSGPVLLRSWQIEGTLSK